MQRIDQHMRRCDPVALMLRRLLTQIAVERWFTTTEAGAVVPLRIQQFDLRHVSVRAADPSQGLPQFRIGLERCVDGPEESTRLFG